MFKKIGSIDNFGVFHHFTGGTLPEFAPFNLIYGWNYSGKTTLSRAFRCLENGERHPDYPLAQFSITDDNGVHHDHSFGTACNVRVFNEDFRKQHLLWDEAEGFSPILLVGEENITLRERLASKEAEQQAADARRTELVTEKGQLAQAVSRAETECASQINRELPVGGRFDRRHLKPIMDTWEGSVPDQLSADEVQTARTKIAAEQKRELPALPSPPTASELHDVWQSGTTLLGEQLGTSETIDRLVENPAIADWVERGRPLHEGRDICEFCEGPLPPERVAALNAHFSDAFEDLKRRVGQSIRDLEAAKVGPSIEGYEKAAFYADMHPDWEESSRELAEARSAFNTSLDTMIEALLRKDANPFEVVNAPEVGPDVEDLSNATRRFSELIESCNERTAAFNAERTAAIETLKGHMTAESMRTVDRFEKLRRIEEAEAEIGEAARDVASLETEISGLQAQLSNATRGADAINQTLQRFFGKQDIQVSVTDDDRFLLMRGDEPARNLSEGERTAIAFCYFITKLFDGGNELSQTVVYIDDPISSLDAHHLLHVCAFIRDTFYRFSSTAPKHRCLAKQLFISTHSHEFFHLMLDWVSKMNGPMSQTFMVERTDANGLITSRIIECPEAIRKYRSEYLYLFHQLVGFSENPQNDHQVIFNLGNMARRFVEGYVAFKFLEHTNIDRSIGELMSDPVDAERARKFMHFHSHTLSRGGGMRLPDMSEAQEIVRSILDAIRNHDAIHYAALEQTR